ncbi:hypothetical protein AB0I28_32945 [Phytomonospora sp. NPDC050363]|uniref:hypothetical protein n=1 Tax=Phytomonospora sp. NPDC050363 TaxID=3155642 RepID=UPI0033ED600B
MTATTTLPPALDGRYRARTGDPRSTVVAFRITPGQAPHVTAAAARRGLTVSGFAAETVLEAATGITSAELADGDRAVLDRVLRRLVAARAAITYTAPRDPLPGGGEAVAMIDAACAEIRAWTR